MYINKVKIRNFRLLKDSVLDLDDQTDKKLSLLIGKNNSGKTSFVMLFDKFLKNSSSFDFDDFSLGIRNKIIDIDESVDEYDLSIQLVLEITYEEADSLENISDLILDLSPEVRKVKILFECAINKKKLVNELSKVKDDRRSRFIRKNLSGYLNSKIYIFNEDDDLKAENRSNLIEKDKKAVDSIINYQVIHAKRSVSSSESHAGSKKVLSEIASNYFNAKTENKFSYEDLDDINASLLAMDASLEDVYEKFFGDFLNRSKDFLGMSDLKVMSDLESKEILSHHSKIIYGNGEDTLPEHLNGLGYMNILYLLLQIEIKKEQFLDSNKDVNILFIEEPEAHTHPQMQTVFIEKIDGLIKDIPSLQTFITTHSAHIVKNSNFRDLRYFSEDAENQNISIKNFYSDLEEKYSEEPGGSDLFQFLQQYLSIASSELFFAEKIIFIEGITEKMLLPYFIQQYDKYSNEEHKLSSQNISVLEVGANAKAFKHFIDFLNTKFLIITDIDTTTKNDNNRYSAIEVTQSTRTSNEALKYFLDAPDSSDTGNYLSWFEKLKNDELHRSDSKVKLSYQTEEGGYHARSFEDAFISLNKDILLANIENIKGLKSNAKEELEGDKNFYELTEEILVKKSEFASSVLWLALTKNVEWVMPRYIKEGLTWIA